MRVRLAFAVLLPCLLAGCAAPDAPENGSQGDGGTPSTADAAPTSPAADACPGHWHSTMKVYVGEREVSFDNRTLERRATPLSSHLHAGDLKYQWHWEPDRSRCIPFGEAAWYAGMAIGEGRLELGGGDHGGLDGTYVANATHRLWLRHQEAGGAWQDISGVDLNARQMRSHERLLVAFGAYDEAQVAALQERVPVSNQRQ